jgi:hypothetical protein
LGTTLELALSLAPKDYTLDPFMRVFERVASLSSVSASHIPSTVAVTWDLFMTVSTVPFPKKVTIGEFGNYTDVTRRNTL